MKLNKILPLISAVAVTFSSAASVHAADLKVGTIDMKAVFDGYYKTKEAEAKINEARTQAKKELDERLDIFNKAQEEARKLNDEANKPELSEKAKAEKSKALNEKLQALGTLQREVQEFQQTRERQLSEQSVRSRNALLEDLNKVIADKVKAAAYDLVLDKSGQSLNAVGILVYSKDSFDFTNDVIAEVNKASKSSPSKK
ncbi:MAG: OmpH family outer membrane protein [Chthoniobacteraceae bacterium]|nr:OmpH family outer membrane protein [Chthoniobacteraceae bacterium]